MESKFLTSRFTLAKKLVNELLEKYEYVSILGKHIYGKRAVVSNFRSFIKDTFETQAGFVVKIYNQGIYKEYSFSDISETNYKEIVEMINSFKLDDSLLQNHMDLSVLKDEPLKKDFERKGEGKKLSFDEIFEQLTKIKDKILAYNSKILQAIAFCDFYDVNSFFISKNRELTQHFAWNTVLAMAVARDGDVIKEARGTYVGNNMEKCLSNAFEKCTEPAQLAIDLLNATSVEPGEYDIITAPSITGLIAHEAFGHGVEMDMFVKHRAKSRLYINKPVASKLVSMHDGASATYSCASFFFDDDGVEAHDTLIIDKGILKTGICDVVAANELGVEPTGNSRRESPYRKAYTRMTNTFFAPGNDDVNEMIKSIKHGYLLCDTNNGMEDPKNWNIQCTAEYGREIKDGKFTGRLISPVVMSGYVPDLLMSISMVSKDFEVIGAGHCGKGHKEWVPVSDGGPYLKARCKLN